MRQKCANRPRGVEDPDDPATTPGMATLALDRRTDRLVQSGTYASAYASTDLPRLRARPALPAGFPCVYARPPDFRFPPGGEVDRSPRNHRDRRKRATHLGRRLLGLAKQLGIAIGLARGTTAAGSPKEAPVSSDGYRGRYESVAPHNQGSTVCRGAFGFRDCGRAAGAPDWCPVRGRVYWVPPRKA